MRHVTTPDPAVPAPAAPDRRARVTAELVGLVLLSLGVAGFMLCLYYVHPALALTVPCAIVAAAGYRLTTTSTEE